VYCIDFDSGKILWQKEVHTGKPAQPIHIKNTYASETPLTDGKRVFFYFGNVGVFCFDFEGKEKTPVAAYYIQNPRSTGLHHLYRVRSPFLE